MRSHIVWVLLVPSPFIGMEEGSLIRLQRIPCARCRGKSSGWEDRIGMSSLLKYSTLGTLLYFTMPSATTIHYFIFNPVHSRLRWWVLYYLKFHVFHQIFLTFFCCDITRLRTVLLTIKNFTECWYHIIQNFLTMACWYYIRYNNIEKGKKNGTVQFSPMHVHPNVRNNWSIKDRVEVSTILKSDGFNMVEEPFRRY